MTTLVHIVAPVRLLRGTFWRDYAVTMRPYLLFVSGITGITGLALARDGSPGSLGALALAFFLAYGFGQALTDCYQLDTDTLSAPYRPLVRGTIRREDVLAVSLMGLALCSVVIGLPARAALPLCALTVIGLATTPSPATLGTNTRLRWSFSPLGDVFLVYNHNATEPEAGGSMRFKSNDLRLKVQYSFRF